MSVIAIFSASYCGGEDISARVGSISGRTIISNEPFELAVKRFGLSRSLLESISRGLPNLIKEIERNRLLNMAGIEAALSEILAADDIIIFGLSALLLPREISHVLRVCLVGDIDFRAHRLAVSKGISEKDAKAEIKKENRLLTEWTINVLGHGPWDEDNFDAIIPMHSTSVDSAARLILEYAQNESVKTTVASQKAVQNFRLASNVKIELARKKHDVMVRADDGKIIITLKKYVVRIDSLKNEIKKIVTAVEGVKDIEFEFGQDFKIPSAWPPMDIDVPKKVLLVDDEREFVQTLSERLQRRKIESTIAYDGEEALQFVGKDQPEVMVLDLKMPGIDGIEVLRRIKKDHPETEVIILTGHGSDRERELAMELGAFAYLEKPVDIEVLSETMKKAYAKVNLTRQSKSSGET